MSEPAFFLQNAAQRFGNVIALDDVSLKIENGEQAALIGPSGSGKTTLLRILNTMQVPCEGEIRVFGADPRRLRADQLRKLRSKIATIPQHLGLVASLSVVQNVLLGKGGQRGTFRSVSDLLFPAKVDLLAVHEILERVGIEEKLYQRTSDLSGGQQQRVAIARALFQQPEALLADEPVSSVDPARARDTVELLGDLSRERGFTLCVSLHNIGLAREFFPRLIGLREGKIAALGSPAKLTESKLENLYRLENGSPG